MKTEVYNVKNEVVGEIELPKGIFGVRWNPDLVAQIITAHMANARRPWAHAKNRAEVRGGGRKPWRQKGTGRARHGSNRSPLWVGGGKAHGPTKLRDYSQKINKKMNRLAILSALSKRLQDKEVKIFDSLAFSEPKTKQLFQTLKGVLAMKKNAKKVDVLIVPSLENRNVFRASRNLMKAKAIEATNLNAYDLMNYKNIFIEKEAVETIGKHFTSNRNPKS